MKRIGKTLIILAFTVVILFGLSNEVHAGEVKKEISTLKNLVYYRTVTNPNESWIAGADLSQAVYTSGSGESVNWNPENHQSTYSLNSITRDLICGYEISDIEWKKMLEINNLTEKELFDKVGYKDDSCKIVNWPQLSINELDKVKVTWQIDVTSQKFQFIKMNQKSWESRVEWFNGGTCYYTPIYQGKCILQGIGDYCGTLEIPFYFNTRVLQFKSMNLGDVGKWELYEDQIVENPFLEIHWLANVIIEKNMIVGENTLFQMKEDSGVTVDASKLQYVYQMDTIRIANDNGIKTVPATESRWKLGYDPTVVKVDANGMVTALREGSARVDIIDKETGAIVCYRVTVKGSDESERYKITGVSSSYTKYYGDKAFTLKVKGNGKITYSSNNKKVVTVDKTKGKVTIKGTGSAVITVKSSDASKKVIINVAPKKNAISKLSAGKKYFKVSYKKDTKATGYQICYSTSKSSKGSKTDTVKNSKITSKTIKKLKSGKTYYVRVRAYKSAKVNGKTTQICSKWCSVKKVKVK